MGYPKEHLAAVTDATDLGRLGGPGRPGRASSADDGGAQAMSRAVGVEIGTSAVRAVEVRATDVGPEVVRFGQVALRAGAVRDGEVIDGAAVAEALRRLWAESGFRAKEAVVGIAGPRIMVRQADVPHTNEED